jgi:hypothetical protein
MKKERDDGLTMNFDKTKTMVFGDKDLTKQMVVDGIQLENVDRFTYLGCNMTYDLDCRQEVMVRIAKAMAALKALDKIWKSKAIKQETKLSVLRTCVFSSMLYGCEAWVITKDIEKRILAFERKCYRRILGIVWTQKVTNVELYNRIRLKENMMQRIIQRKLGLFGHICRMSNDRKIKTLVFGMMDGRNKRGRPHREWADDLTDWCGTSLQKLSHIALKRELWKNMVKMASDTYGR